MVLSAGADGFDCLLCGAAVHIGLCYDIDVGLSCLCPDFNLKIYRPPLDKKSFISQTEISTLSRTKVSLYRAVKRKQTKRAILDRLALF